MSTLCLFPDTNFFIQCRPLEEIDWSPWESFDEVHIIVCRPVQREIDNQKNRGGDRVGKRVRKTNTLFRELIIGGSDKIVRKTGPKLLMRIDPSIRPNPALKDQLDYSKTDDEIVGCVHAFLEANPGEDARLLTHDSGPMATAQMLGMNFISVPDEWLIPPESNDEEREMRRLQAELTRLRKAEPEFHISYLDQDGKEIESLEINHVFYKALTAGELATLMDSLKSRFPVATDFNEHDKPEDVARTATNRAGMQESYTPPSDDQIEAYTNEKYPNWLAHCEEILQHLHHSLNEEADPPLFRIAARNDGNRPGKDALITITACGDFQIRPPEYRDNDDQEKAVERLKEKLNLPPPPTPPRGKWTRTRAGFPSNIFDHMKAIQGITSPHSGLEAHLRALSLPSDFQRDPNAFYYKEDRSPIPVQSYSLECEQWRHGLDAEHFEGEIHVSDDETEVRGALECTIHAENLSSLIRKTIPVRISVTTVSAYERAQDLVHKLID